MSTGSHPLGIQCARTSTSLPALTPSQCGVDVEPHSLVGAEDLHQEVVDDHRLTEHPGEDGEEQVVEEGRNKGADTLGEGGGA